MKVLHLISGGDTGGAKTHMFSLLTCLKDFIDVKLVCFIKDSFFYEAVDLGIDAIVIEQKNRADMSVVKDIRKIVEEENFDLVHCHGARANTVGFFLKNKIDVPMVTTIHSDYELDFKDNFYKRLIFTTINKIALKRFDYYIGITEGFKNMLVSRGFDPDSIYVMYNGIDPKVDPNILDRKEYFKERNIDYNGEFIIGQGARMDNVKNVSMSVEVGKILKENGLDFKILLAGDGEQYQEISDKIREYNLEDQVLLLGFEEDNFSFFNSLDLNVLTSFSESFPYSILEASILGVPTVATKVGGIPEQIRDGIDGALVESDNPEEMAQVITKLYNDRSLLEEYSNSMKSRVIEKFSNIAMAKRQEEIYTDILKRGK